MITYKGKQDVFTDSRIIGFKNWHELMNAVLHSLLANEVDLFVLPRESVGHFVIFFFVWGGVHVCGVSYKQIRHFLHLMILTSLTDIYFSTDTTGK